MLLRDAKAFLPERAATLPENSCYAAAAAKAPSGSPTTGIEHIVCPLFDAAAAMAYSYAIWQFLPYNQNRIRCDNEHHPIIRHARFCHHHITIITPSWLH